MRLLAYGGTRYAERARVGRWSDSLGGASSDFEDTFDIPAGQGLLSYGVGIIDNAAVLILRERQNEADRGGYPYTLLLDPGAGVWQRFEWNAPLLAASLRASADLWKQLMHEPQRLSSAALLEGGLRELPAVDPGGGATVDVGAALAATLQQDGLHFPVSLFGLKRRPALEDMARAVTALPPFARVGGGWMMGGGRNGRRSLGCRAVFDDVSPAADPDPRTRAALDEGRELLQVSAELFRSIGDPAGVASIAAPDVAWSVPPGAVFRALRLAAAAARGAIDKATIDAVTAFLSERTPYGAPLLDLWKSALPDAPLSSAVSRVFLKHDWDRIDSSLGGRLAADALGEEFHARGMTPAAAGAERFGLTPQREAAVWTGLAARATDPAHIVALVGDAAERTTRGAEDALQPLVEAAIERTLELQGLLRAWLALRDRQNVWRMVGGSVSAAARKRAGTDTRWHVDYALLGDDPGGAWLASRHPDDVAQVARAVLDESSGGPHAEAAGAWLSAMAGTPARRHAELDQKLEIARRVGGRWSRLTALERIFAGEPGAFNAPAPGTEETPALLEEAGELFAMRARQASRPPLDLEGIERAFDGQFDPGYLLRWTDALAPVTPQSVAWLTGRGAASTARHLAVQAWLDGGEPAVPLDQMDDEGLASLVSRIFAGTAPPSETERTLAADLLTVAQESSARPLMTLIAESLTAASRDQQKATHVAQLISPDPELAASTLGWIDPRDAGALLHAAAHGDPPGVARLVENLVSHVSERRSAESLAAIRAIEDFLRRSSPAVRVVRDRAGRALFGADASHLAGYVAELARTVELEAARDEDPGAAGLMRRVRDWFQTRHH